MENDINIDLHRGRVDGLVGSCKVEDFMCSLSEDLKASLQRAKGVMIEFEHHDDLAISAIGSLVEELHTFIGTDPDIIFGTKENNALQKNMIDFRLIVTGIDKEISI